MAATVPREFDSTTSCKVCHARFGKEGEVRWLWGRGGFHWGARSLSLSLLSSLLFSFAPALPVCRPRKQTKPRSQQIVLTHRSPPETNKAVGVCARATHTNRGLFNPTARARKRQVRLSSVAMLTPPLHARPRTSRRVRPCCRGSSGALGRRQAVGPQAGARGTTPSPTRCFRKGGVCRPEARAASGAARAAATSSSSSLPSSQNTPSPPNTQTAGGAH